MSNGLYPDQNIRSAGTELGQNYLQMLSADKERLGRIQKRLIQMKDIKLITR